MKISNICLAVLVAALVARPIAAQDDAAVRAHVRNQCRLAGQVLTTGHPANKREWAEGMIINCGEEAPPIFVRRWSQVPSDTTAVSTLLRASATIRDQRIFTAAEQVARDRSRSPVVRVGAMMLLVRNVDPANSTWYNELVPTESSLRAPRASTSWGTHGYQEPGAQPLGPVKGRVLTVLQAIAADAGEPLEVRHAATVLALTVERVGT